MKWKLSKDIVFSKVDDEVVIMSLHSDSYIGLNEVGTRIWELLNETPQTVTDIVEVLLEEYVVDRSVCMEQVSAYLEDLNRKGLLEAIEEK